MNFKILVKNIQHTHDKLQEQAIHSVNIHLTIRNWLIGFYIAEFEQQGADRAKYGQRLIDELALSINIKGLSARNLKLFRQFYFTYPQVATILTKHLHQLGFNTITQDQSGKQKKQNSTTNILIVQTPSAQSKKLIMQTPSAQSKKFKKSELLVPPDKLINHLSFSHFALLLSISEPLKRAFYEIECIKGNWSHDELKRQISTLYFERSNMSRKPEKLSTIIQKNSQTLTPSDIIKSPFTFEFLGLKAKDVVYESDLEQALIDHFEGFLLEMGHGFCFEAKQKRITIGSKYYFIDLVFYHRILKCHVLVELKTQEVEHQHIGQLKTYINYFKKNFMAPGDNPPVGILLVAENDRALVEYAVADSDKDLFVSKYVLELPSTRQIKAFIQKEINR
jgi:predicted nuclease of restriction endonuclease-like (RecB) superfamily